MLNFFKKREPTFREALEVVRKAIREDEGLYQTYQANIAMAFHDEVSRSQKVRVSKANLHQISNRAADCFLNLWVRG